MFSLRHRDFPARGLHCPARFRNEALRGKQRQRGGGIRIKHGDQAMRATDLHRLSEQFFAIASAAVSFRNEQIIDFMLRFAAVQVEIADCFAAVERQQHVEPFRRGQHALRRPVNAAAVQRAVAGAMRLF